MFGTHHFLTFDLRVFILFIKKLPNVWLYCLNCHPVWPLEITFDNILHDWQNK